ncbi:DNA internalization-related competence protein ComEC/Rec2 [Frateuria aurantia]
MAVVLLAGVLPVQWLPRLWPVRLSLGLMLLAGLLAVWAGRYGRLAGWTLFSVCWAACWGQAGMDARLPRAWEGRDFGVDAVIVDLPLVRTGATTFLARVRTRPGSPSWHGKVRLSWYRPPVLRPCQHWQLRLRLRRPRGLINPGTADSERSALEHGVQAVGYVREAAQARRLGETHCIDGARAMLSRRISATLPGRHSAALLRAFAVGDIGGLVEDDWAVARANGIPHLIAISGFHVGMAGWMGAMLVLALYRCMPGLGLRWPRPLATQMAVLACAGGYCALAGFGIACMRTLLMMAAAMLFRLLRRTSRPSSGLLLALASVLLVDPLACLSAGFWLSFVGVSVLIYVLQGSRGGWCARLREITVGQWLMTASMLPLTLWFFGEASWVGAVSNVLAVPWISFLVVPLVLLSLPLLWLGVQWAYPVIWLAALATDALWRVLVWLGQWPGAHWHPIVPGLAALVMATTGVVWGWLPRDVPMRWLGGVLLLPLFWPSHQRPAEGGVRVWALDVGQGLAVLVETRGHLLAYDAGARYRSGYDLGAAVVVPAIYASGAAPLDGLMISHGDNDHAGGALAVAQAFPEARRWSGEPARMAYPSEHCQAGNHWRWDGVEFRVLAPPDEGVPGTLPKARNRRSCVLHVVGRAGALLLTGDIDQAEEQSLLGALSGGPPTVLQVPHHGSRSASSAIFLDVLRPREAWVAAGWRNRFGHPDPQVVARYRRRGVPLWNIAQTGAMVFELPADGPPRAAVGWRRRQRRYWRE